MTRLSKVLSIIILSLFISNSLHAQEQINGLTWYTNINQVYELSHKTQKPVFALFTGSDWCYWCHKLDNEVFEKAGFQEWAKKNVILLMLDFPRNKRLPDDLAKQNNELQQFFAVRGYPTVWMFSMSRDSTNRYNISALGSLGYPQAKPGKEEQEFLKEANQILKNKK